jgi:hypothetical protein
MRISASIFLVALGAFLTFAVHVQATGFTVRTAGIILMVTGIGALVVILALWSPRPRKASNLAPTDDPVGPRRTYGNPTRL